MADISDTILTELRNLIKEIKKVYDKTPRGTAEDTAEDMEKYEEDLRKVELRLAKIQGKYDDTNKSLEAQIGLLEEANDIQGEYLGILNKAQENEEEQLRLLREQIDLKEDQIELLRKKGLPYKTLQEDLDILIALEKERTKTLEEQKEATNALKTASDGFEDIIETFTGVTRSSDGFLSSVMKASEGTSGFGGVVKQLGDRFMSIMTPMNIALSIFSKIQEVTGVYAKDLDQVTSQLAASTAETEKYNYVLQNSWREMGRFGMGVQEAGEAQLALKRESLSFSELNKSQQMQLVKTTAAMERFGLSSQETASTFDTLANALGFTAEESQEALREVASLSNKLQIDSGTLTKAFAASQKSLAAYGKAAPKIFAEVAAASKATRIEVGRLLEITGQFDTFESAAQAAGSLNAILGGDLVNSMELLSSTEAEREDIISNVMDTARKQYQGMGEVQQKYLVKTLGSALQMSDEEVKKYLNNSSSRLAEYDAEAAKRTANQEEFNKALAAATPIATKFMQLAMQLAAPIGRFIDFVDKGVDSIFKLSESFEGFSIAGEKVSGLFTIFTGAGGVAAIAAIKSFSAFLSGAGAAAAFGAVGAAIAGIAGAVKGFFDQIKKIDERWQEKFGFGMFDVLRETLSNLVYVLGVVGKVAMKVFGGIFEFFKPVGSLIAETIIAPLEYLLTIGKAIKQLFDGEFMEAFKTFAGGFANFAMTIPNWFLGEIGQERVELVDDFILRPGKEPIKFNKDDLIMGGTSLLSQNSQAYSNVSNTSIFNGGGAAPAAPMRDRDLVIQIDGREIARVASKHLKKEYGFSYG